MRHTSHTNISSYSFIVDSYIFNIYKESNFVWKEFSFVMFFLFSSSSYHHYFNISNDLRRLKTKVLRTYESEHIEKRISKSTISQQHHLKHRDLMPQ